jgi:hypothetical protein
MSTSKNKNVFEGQIKNGWYVDMYQSAWNGTYVKFSNYGLGDSEISTYGLKGQDAVDLGKALIKAGEKSLAKEKQDLKKRAQAALKAARG